MKALRSAEWLLIGYFGYVALISPFLRHAQSLVPFEEFLLVLAMLLILAAGESRLHEEGFSVARDWVPLGLTLVAYREMNLFTPLVRDYHLELHWIEWDRWLLNTAGLQRAIESLGALIPGYLEFCYLLVYAVGPFTVAVMYFEHRRDLVNKVVLVYLLGTLSAYALFPYFPSDPPRVVFGGSDLPNIVTALRRFNLWIVGGYGIHSSVFPSAHVSSAFSAAWALFKYLPRKKAFGWGMLIYAISVALATVYGRYHYATDALAGFGVSLIAAGYCYFAADERPASTRG